MSESITKDEAMKALDGLLEKQQYLRGHTPSSEDHELYDLLRKFKLEE